jgi:hypothetical protein
VAQLGKDQNLVFNNGERIKLTHFGTFAAIRASGPVDLGDGNTYRNPLSLLKGKEKMEIGFFHITIQELNILQG